MCCDLDCFFFFKQKTAYEMRISDWSSDVCSSDLPDVVFADEPTGNLDSRSGADVLRFLRRSVDDLGQTLVMVTHDPGAASHADRVLFLADGAVVDERSEERRVGRGGVSTCRSRWSTYN